MPIKTFAERLQKPNIQTHTWVSSGSVKRGCWMEVHCSTLDEGVEFSWQVNPPSVTTINMSLPDSNAALLLAFFNTTQIPVNFTCTTSRNMEKASSVVTPKCEGMVYSVVI